MKDDVARGIYCAAESQSDHEVTLRPITETCEPRHDVLEGGLQDKDFAAQLEKVVAGDKSYRAYTEAAEFFDLTFPTTGLRDLIAETFGHLTGHGGSSILRAQTSFGGGKTHSLIALYHLAQGHRPANLDEFVDDPAILPDGPVRIAAVVADQLDPVKGTTASGRTTYTLWGEIASQLGDNAWQAVAEHEQARTAPGTEAIRKMLDGGPAIIVLDEIAQHLVQCDKAGTEDIRRQALQIAPFLKNLSEEVDGRDDISVVITLASHTDAYAEATAELERSFADVGAVLARKGRDIQPAAEAEIAEILKRRLFASIDPAAASEAAAAYRELYAQAGDTVGITAKVGTETAEKVAVTYPFHPELVRLLDQRIGTIPKFQRTRGALRLLSQVVASIWQAEGRDPVILNVADLPLDLDRARYELTDRIDRSKFTEVIRADIAGTDPFAARIDHERYQDRPVAARAATTVLAHSLEETAEAGSPLPEIALGTLRPGDAPELIEDALGRLHAVAWHLSFDNVRWRFQTAPNANRIVSTEADRVLPTTVHDQRWKILTRMCRPTATIDTHVYPDDLDTLPDEEKLHLAVPHHGTVAVTVKTADTPPALLQQARARSGAGKRANRNGIAYLVADTDRVDEMGQAVRRMVAAQAIVEDEVRMSSYAETVQRQLQEIADSSHLKAHVAVGRCYRHLYFPKANKPGGDLVHVELPSSVQGAIGDRPPKSGSLPSGKSWTDQVWNTLSTPEVAKVRNSDDAISTDWLRKKAWPHNADRVRTSSVLATFWRDHSAQLLTDTGPVVRSIQQGVANGSWVLQDMRDATDARGKVRSDRDKTSTPPPADFDDDVWLVDYQAAVDDGLLATPTTSTDVTRLLDRSGGEPLDAATLRERLEDAKGGHEPTKQEVREALAHAVKSNQIVVEKDGEPVKAGDLSGDKAGFDGLVIRRADPDDVDDDKPTGPKTRAFKEPAAVAAERLSGWVSENIVNGHSDGLTEITVTVEVDDDQPQAAGILITMLGSLPDFTDITFTTDITYGLDGLDGELSLSVPAADRRQAQQQAKALLTALGSKATPEEGRATITFTLDEPHAPDAPKVAGLFKTLTTYITGQIELRGRIA